MSKRTYLADSRGVRLFVEFADQISFGYEVVDENEVSTNYLISFNNEQWKEIQKLHKAYLIDPQLLPDKAGYLK